MTSLRDALGSHAACAKLWGAAATVPLADLGNGTRPDVWDAFKERFHIPQILEFYAATEGNVSLFNVEGKPGALGRVPPYLADRFPVALVKLEDDTGAPIRNVEGCGMSSFFVYLNVGVVSTSQRRRRKSGRA